MPMTVSELKHLVKMANQISDNLSRSDDAETTATRVADHMIRFWAPSMKAKIIEYLNAGGKGLKEPTRLAVQQISAASN